MADFDNARNLRGVIGKDHHFWLVALDGETITLINEEFGIVGDHSGGTNDRSELIEDFRIHGEAALLGGRGPLRSPFQSTSNTESL